MSAITQQLMSYRGSLDPYFSSVIALLPMGGSAGTSAGIDVTGRTWTTPVVCDATTNPFGSGTSGKFNGAGDTCTSVADTIFNMTNLDFTFEAWVFPTAVGAAEGVIFTKWDAATHSYFYCLGTGAVPKHLAFYSKVGGVDAFPASTGTISNSVWSFVSATRLSGTLYWHSNGINIGSVAVGTIDNSTAPQRIGVGEAGAHAFTGYMSNVRVTKGVARYTASNYSVPTAPFPTS